MTEITVIWVLICFSTWFISKHPGVWLIYSKDSYKFSFISFCEWKSIKIKYEPKTAKQRKTKKKEYWICIWMIGLVSIHCEFFQITVALYTIIFLSFLFFFWCSLDLRFFFYVLFILSLNCHIVWLTGKTSAAYEIKVKCILHFKYRVYWINGDDGFIFNRLTSHK